jgi:hypothetical protein
MGLCGTELRLGSSRGKLNCPNVDTFSDLLPTALPDTIEDAIAVVIQLDFRYLWVDRYCID